MQQNPSFPLGNQEDRRCTLAGLGLVEGVAARPGSKLNPARVPGMVRASATAVRLIARLLGGRGEFENSDLVELLSRFQFGCRKFGVIWRIRIMLSFQAKG